MMFTNVNCIIHIVSTDTGLRGSLVVYQLLINRVREVKCFIIWHFFFARGKHKISQSLRSGYCDLRTVRQPVRMQEVTQSNKVYLRQLMASSPIGRLVPRGADAGWREGLVSCQLRKRNHQPDGHGTQRPADETFTQRN